MSDTIKGAIIGALIYGVIDYIIPGEQNPQLNLQNFMHKILQ